jgi:ATP/maltotriose-dependent transcriptional regulator MalT
METGRYEQALRVLNNAESFLGAHPGGYFDNVLSLLEGEVLYYHGRKKEGRSLIDEVIANLGEKKHLGHECELRILGDFERREHYYPDSVRTLEASLARLKNMNGRIYTRALTLVSLGASRLHLNGVDDGLAAREIDEAERIALRCGYRYIETHVGFLRAWIALNQGDEEGAIRHLTPSLALASRCLHVHYYLQEGRLCKELLALAFARNIHRDFLKDIFIQMGEESIQALLPLMQSDDVNTRIDTLNTIALAGGVSAAPHIYRFLKDDDNHVRVMAKKAVAMLREHIKDPGEVLTRRENEVLKYMSQGVSNAEIAESLYITEPTVKTHVTRIFQKLGVTKRTQAAAFYHQRLRNGTMKENP